MRGGRERRQRGEEINEKRRKGDQSGEKGRGERGRT